MASNIALAFSKVIDPNNPLYLDESCNSGGAIDWEFGSVSPENEEHVGDESSRALTEKDVEHKAGEETEGVKRKNKKVLEYKLIDPDEIVDPATLNCNSGSDENGNNADDNGSENSDASSDSSLQPYDLADDDSDLKKNLTQLVDVVGALRKSDDADGVSLYFFFYHCFFSILSAGS